MVNQNFMENGSSDFSDFWHDVRECYFLLSLSGPALNTSVLSQEPISSKRVGVSSRLNHLDRLVLILSDRFLFGWSSIATVLPCYRAFRM